MELSELVVTPQGYLKESYCANSEWAGIVGIHFWKEKLLKQEWRNLEAMSWKRLQEEFQQK